MFPVAIPEGPHPFPYRTRKLSPPRPMLLLPRGSGKVGRCRVTTRSLLEQSSRLFYFVRLAAPTTFYEASRWVLPGDVNYDTAMKSRRYERAWCGPLRGWKRSRWSIDQRALSFVLMKSRCAEAHLLPHLLCDSSGLV